MRLFTLIGAVLALFAIATFAGCGGGGSTPTPPESQSFNIPANTAIEEQIGEFSITVPKEAFPDGTTMTVIQQEPIRFPASANTEKIGDKAEIKIAFSSEPQAPVTIMPLAGSRSGGDLVARMLRWTGNRWEIVNSVAHDWINQSELLLETGEFILTEGVYQVGGVLVTAPSDGPAEETIELAINEAVGDDAPGLIMIPGLMGKPSNFQTAADYINRLGIYREIVGLGYNTYQDVAVSATELAEWIQEFRAIGCNRIEIFSHSAGTIVARYDLEQRGDTKDVKQLYAICGPNTGSVWATAADTLKALQEWYFNTPADQCPSYGIATVYSPIIQQLKPDGPFLQGLNTPTVKQRGAVSYTMFGGGLDVVVSADSGLATNVPLEALTGGAVERHYIATATHSNLFQTRAGLDIVSQNIWGQGDLNVSLITPATCEGDYDRWDWSAQMVNNGSRTVILEDFSMDGYDIEGTWTGSWWYDPATLPGVTFPEDYVRWGKTLGTGQNCALDIEVHDAAGYIPISQLPEESQAFTYIVTLRISDEDQQFYRTKTIRFGYNSVWPADPQTRTKGVTRSRMRPPTPTVRLR